MELEQEGIFFNESYQEYDHPGSVPFLFKVRLHNSEKKVELSYVKK